ncbi:MAG: hypothetical protein V7641_4927 [Blastocatellia bacterium]
MNRVAEIQDSVQGEWAGLQTQWETTRQNWRDAVAEQFEREFWGALQEEMAQLIKAMAELDDVLDQALRNTAD